MKANGYEFVERTKVNGVVVIVPVTDDGSLLFIEQYRPPVQNVCIEFPAGLSGDNAASSDEELETAAAVVLERRVTRLPGWSGWGLPLDGRSDVGSVDLFSCQWVAESGGGGRGGR
ncbi:MAG: hypothetical protein U0903_06585 [Planctomycetales bacterium]